MIDNEKYNGGRTRSSIQLNDSAVVRRNIDVKCRRYFGFALTLLALFSSTSCTRSDSNSENLEVELPGDTTVLPEETIDYTGLRKFISEVSETTITVVLSQPPARSSDSYP